MNQKRIKQRFDDYSKALDRLIDVLERDIKKDDVFVDATMQRFEFTFELSWKLLKDVLAFEGVETKTPRDCIKEAYQKEAIEDGEGWLKMLEDRNKTTHVYDEKQIMEIYVHIKETYCELLKQLKKKIEESV